MASTIKTVGNSVRVLVPAGEVSPPIDVNGDAVVVCVPGSAGTMLAEATWSLPEDIRAGEARWFSWDAGAVTGPATQFLVKASAVRFTATAAAGVGEVSR